MTLFGLTIARTKRLPSESLSPADNRGGWWRWFVSEALPGDWQRNVEITIDNVTTNSTLFACVTLIANDISKMRLRLVQQDTDGIWNETESPSFSPVLRKPNHYQNRIQFFFTWLISKLLHGNTYVLKVRDNRQIVTALYVLDPTRTIPLVAPDGSVFYQVKKDDLSQLPEEQYIFPASEIIHDRHNTLFHPLVGLSSIYACGLAAVQGLNIQNNSTKFFANGSRPGGVLTAPGAIAQPTADRIKAYWDANFTGDNAGKVAVLGDGLKYEQMRESATDSQLIEQLRWTSENICSAFHVPPYMVGVGSPPTYNNIEALNQQYYSQCLQVLIESVELCLDEGQSLTEGAVAAQRYGTEFDIEDLLRMDSATMMNYLEKGKNYFQPNEGRKKLNLPPVDGGDTVYRQQQDFSLEALNKRDALDDPFGKATPAVAGPPALPAPTMQPSAKQLTAVEATKHLQDEIRKRLAA